MAYFAGVQQFKRADGLTATLPVFRGDWRALAAPVDLSVSFASWRLEQLHQLRPSQAASVDLSVSLAPLPTAVELSSLIAYWRNVGESITLFPYQIELLEQLYIFRRPNEVDKFLNTYPFLVALLIDAYFQIAKYFGTESDVVLEVVTDPEATDDRELCALIRTGLSPDDALGWLQRLDEGWWLEAMDRARGNLCIDVEFL